MLWSKLFIPTLRENPAEAEVASHQLLLRAGYIRQLSAGIYNYLFLAQRSLLKIQQIVRDEMDAIGAQEVFLPALHPAELWQQSGRWDVMGDTMFRLKDRFGRDLCLGMTHEEIVTVLARGELRSYKQLPQIWYQIQTKFRDEPRPKSGLLRVRQFLMKDAYSFDMDQAGLDVAYEKHYQAYRRIFDRCGLDYTAVEAHSGTMGGSQSHEFVVASDAGEDLIAICKGCGYAANLEKAVSQPALPEAEDPAGPFDPQPFHTPGRKTIAEVAEFTGLPAASQMKSLILVADGKPVLALLRGDHQLSGAKFAAVVGDPEFRPAHPEEIREWFGADA
ncbi:MAG: proline--tRNA ligase, partial [Terriglobia bacterium]